MTAAQFQRLADVPPEVEWFANIENPRTRRAYRIDLHDFMSFVSIATPAEVRTVTRSHVIARHRTSSHVIARHRTSSHVIAWPKVVETRGAARATIRRKPAGVTPDVLPEINGILKREKLRWVVNVREDVNVLGRVRPQYAFVQMAMTAHASFRNPPGIWATPR